MPAAIIGNIFHVHNYGSDFCNEPVFSGFHLCVYVKPWPVWGWEKAPGELDLILIEFPLIPAKDSRNSLGQYSQSGRSDCAWDDHSAQGGEFLFTAHSVL